MRGVLRVIEIGADDNEDWIYFKPLSYKET